MPGPQTAYHRLIPSDAFDMIEENNGSDNKTDGLIVNKVAESDIRTFNLEKLWDGGEVEEFDIAQWLFKGLVLKEKDFREHVRSHDWSRYSGKHVAVFCSTDAILPTWAPMLVASRISPFSTSVAFGSRDELIRDHFVRALARTDWTEFEGAPVVVKGCASKVVPQSAYVEACVRLQAVAGKLMFGEACSAVPLWRRPTDAGAQAASAKPAVLPADFMKSR